MENLRRSLNNNNRSRDQPPQQQQPGLKKPRLNEDPRLLARFNRDATEINNTGGAYQPQMPNQHQELVSQYKRALAELTFNSKPIITNLTIIAGENQHAAKAISATLCTHIIEFHGLAVKITLLKATTRILYEQAMLSIIISPADMPMSLQLSESVEGDLSVTGIIPNDQKLPSLYLLDSIVKNIGRDYIKYFAPRLPEVFCMAYNNVSPGVCSSMRHLFGTWKDVFPPQTLQSIEKELGFTPIVNGSSAGTQPSRSDSQSQRPPHSIHVNPKYLERQRIQQSTRPKGIDIEPTEDLERPDRAANVSNVRTWVNPSIKLQQPPKSEPAHDPGYGPEFSRTPDLGVGRASGGRIAEQVNGKSWQGIISSVPETITSRGNGVISNKRAPPSYPAVKTSILTQSIVGRNKIGLSSSWKNSEEEEFLWDMHSRLPDNDAANISSHTKKDWFSDDSEKLEYEIHKRPLSSHDNGSMFDRENSADSLSSEQKEQATTYGHRVPSPRLLQDSPHLIEGPMATGVHTSGSSSLVRTGVRPQMNSSNVGASGHKIQSVGAGSLSGRPSTHQRPPTPLLSSRLKSLEQDPLQPVPLLRRDTKTTQRGGPQKKSPNIQLANSKKSQKQNLSNSSPKVLTSLSIQQQSVKPESTTSEPPGLSFDKPPTTETSGGQPSTSSLLAAVLSSGILTNTSITGTVPSKNVRQIGKKPSPSLVSSRPPPTKVASVGSKTPQDSTLARTKNAVTDPTNPVSNLLSSLMEKGLISASEKDLQSKNPPQSLDITNKAQLSSVPVSSENSLSSATDEKHLSKPSAKSCSVSLPHVSSSDETKNLIGLVFKPNIIREFHPHVVSSLFDGLPYECTICGLKLKLQETLDRHLEWHDLSNPEAKSVDVASKRWYVNSEEWVAGRAELFDDDDSYLEDSGKMTSGEHVPMVPADEYQCACILCGQLFEDYYNKETNEWMFKGAVYMTIPFGDCEIIGASSQTSANGPIVHVNCVSETSVHDLGLTTGVKLVLPGFFWYCSNVSIIFIGS
ncbi:hypothetical protein ACFE04_002431 [Oxalis oulophora]